MRLQARRLLEFLRESLWLFPALGVLVAFVVQVLLLEVDRSRVVEGEKVLRWFVFGGGAESARTFLSTMATSVLAMTTLVFSITMLVLQLASSQLSPRVTRTFLRDRPNQLVLALFVATFVYSLLALREVRNDFVPGVVIWVGFLATMASVGAFVYFLSHVAHSIRVSTVVDRVARETLDAVERLYPEGLGDGGDAGAGEVRLPDGAPGLVLRWRERSAVVTGVDAGGLLTFCAEQGCVIEVVPRVGDFMARGGVVARAWGDVVGLDEALLGRVLSTGVERTMWQDAAFGVRQLVDIAERALSPGTNDPSTAVQVLDQLHDVLAVLMVREMPSPFRLSEEGGELLLVLPRPGWEEYVSLALDEIRECGGGSSQVRERLRLLVSDLLERAPASRREALVLQAGLLDRLEVSG